MFRRTLAVLILATAIAGCSSGSEAEAPSPTTSPTTASSSTTSTSIPSTTVPTTTSTTEALRHFEPLYADPTLPVHDQVEAAYLFHWEVLLDSGRTGRTDYLPLVFAGEILQQRIEETRGIVESGQRVGGYVEHNYGIAVLSDEEAVVADEYLSQLTRIDEAGNEAPGAATGTLRVYEYRLRKSGGQWHVVHVVEYGS